MSSLEQLWAGWRRAYVEGTVRKDLSPDISPDIFQSLAESDHADSETFILYRGKTCFAILNIYPYSSGHTLILPYRVVGNLEDLDKNEFQELWETVRDSATAIKTAYNPDGINIGANFGKAAGAGIPNHLHVHCLPRWEGDTNFMTSVANSKVMPEALDETWRKLKEAWPKK